jgi:hypothetical protein
MQAINSLTRIEFFFNGKYIINSNQVSVQDEQRLHKRVGAVYKRNTNENTKTNTT